MKIIDTSVLRTIRLHELGRVRRLLPPGSTVLEIGGGSGWQAAELAAAGFTVHSLDLVDNPYRDELVWPVVTYDGAHLPYPESSFDAIFSSNVLEHLPEPSVLLGESRRVLRPGGIAIHLMPTPAWRLWTSLAHYVWLPGFALQMIRRRGGGLASSLSSARQRTPLPRLIMRALFPTRHGERGNVLSELWYFSSRAWTTTFAASGWKVVEHRPVDLFYTGYLLFPSLMSIAVRRKLASVLGAGCRMYVLHPRQSSGN